MFNPLHIPEYQRNFWDKTTLGEKAFVVTYSITQGVALRIFSAMKNDAPIPFFPKSFGPYESAGTLMFLIYLVGSTFLGYLNSLKKID